MKKYFYLLLFFIFCIEGFSHPIPNSVMLLDIKNKQVLCEIQMPLKELQLAVPFDVTNNTENLLKNHREDLLEYILKHFHIEGSDKTIWNISVLGLKIDKAEQTATGVYKELIVSYLITPKNNASNKQFTIFYDAISHQVVTHKTILSVRQDWDNGSFGEKNTEIGIISYDSDSKKVLPFLVNIENGSNWKGFRSMVVLGMNHIAQGSDHLLFLLVLLLCAPLIANGKRWENNQKIKYSLIRILKITTAFTIGHSITLLIGTLGWLQPQPKIIEILIAISILITAIHAIRPIFPDKEIFVAAGFGLIHGLAFATVLCNLKLETSKTILSLLGFNIGIEIMQVFVIMIVMPWILILSKDKIYTYFRFFGAIFAAIASIAWILERYSEKSNWVSIFIQKILEQSIWIVFTLAGFVIVHSLSKNYFLPQKNIS